MAMGTAGGRGTRSSINVTPLIDVLLVLLIIFMVIQPTVQRGLDALAPKPPNSHAVEPDPRTLVITVQGRAGTPMYALNEQPVALPDLRPRLERIVRQSGRRMLFVQGSPDLDYAAIAPVLDAAHAAGAVDIGVLTLATLQPR